MAYVIDPANKRIILDVTDATAQSIYRAWVDWLVLSDNSKYLPAFRTTGGDDLGSGIGIPAYYFLTNGWFIRPMESNHTLTITGNLFVDGGGDPIVPTLGTFNVLTKLVVPVQAQTVNTGGVGTVAEVADAVWNAIASNYLTVGSTGAKLSAAGSAGDPWTTDLSTYNTVGTAGYLAKSTNTNTTTIINEFGNISVASSAVNHAANSFTLTAGTVSAGTFNDTKTFDLGEHHLTSAAGDPSILDCYYDFDIGADKVPSTFTFLGHTLPQNHTVLIQAYNWVTLGYETIGEITGLKTNNTINCALFDDQQNSSGKVRVRFYVSGATTTELHIDQIYVSYSVIAPSAVDIASEVRTELTPELTHILQVPTTGTGLTGTQATMLLEMYTLLGLDPAKPLLVTETARSAGTINQTIVTNSTQTSVIRV
jgi:hypothetical protein